jgi:hypothetical protein
VQANFPEAVVQPDVLFAPVVLAAAVLEEFVRCGDTNCCTN